MIMGDNLKIYNAVREVPKEAQRPIQGGRLRGKTDINPMWRIKVLTEQFGPCGIGWYAEILSNWLEPASTGEVSAHIKIALRVKVDGEWSQPIMGIGGSMYVANEKSGANVSDECFKMAYTDAISVACKMLGIGANVYWDSDRSKYNQNADDEPSLDTNSINEAPPIVPKPRHRVTMDMLDDQVKCNCLLNWAYGFYTADGYPKEWDAGARLLKSYDAESDVVLRFSALFESYKQAKSKR